MPIGVYERTETKNIMARAMGVDTYILRPKDLRMRRGVRMLMRWSEERHVPLPHWLSRFMPARITSVGRLEGVTFGDKYWRLYTGPEEWYLMSGRRPLALCSLRDGIQLVADDVRHVERLKG